MRCPLGSRAGMSSALPALPSRPFTIVCRMPPASSGARRVDGRELGGILWPVSMFFSGGVPDRPGDGPASFPPLSSHASRGRGLAVDLLTDIPCQPLPPDSPSVPLQAVLPAARSQCPPMGALRKPGQAVAGRKHAGLPRDPLGIARVGSDMCGLDLSRDLQLPALQVSGRTVVAGGSARRLPGGVVQTTTPPRLPALVAGSSCRDGGGDFGSSPAAG